MNTLDPRHLDSWPGLVKTDKGSHGIGPTGVLFMVQGKEGMICSNYNPTGAMVS